MNPLAGLYDGLRPPERVTPSEWADRYRFLSSKASAEPGRWKTSRTPYLREPMDCFDNYSPVEEVVFMKGAQIGATEALYNIMAYYIDVAPGPILSVMPTESTSKKNTRLRFNPMVAATPRLSEKIGASKSRDASNTIHQKDFPGGAIIFGIATSAPSLRSLPIRVLLMDEIDGYPNDVAGEGSPVNLAVVRTTTFSNRKIAYTSTPTEEDTSKIAAEFENSDQRYYHVPCPHCGSFQKLVWSQIRYDETARRITDATYECIDCGEQIEERFKTQMFAAGEWVPENPALLSKTRRGYHLSGLYSPHGWQSWAQLAQKYETAKRENSDEKMRVFINTALGETVKTVSVTPKPQRLYDRAGGYARGTLPQEAALLTAGVDVQQQRIEAEVVAWSDRGQSWSIDYYILHGDTTQPEVWAQLTRVLYRTWKRPDGREIGLSKMAVDSGYNTQEVYNWCRHHSPALVMAVKGQDHTKQSTMIRASQAVDVTGSGKKIPGVGLWTIGVDLIKSEVYAKLLLELNADGEYPIGYCHFPDGYPLDYYKMLCAERREARKDSKGYLRYSWVKTQPRNESFDCRVYARAAVHLVGVDRWTAEDWRQEHEQGYTPPNPTAPAPPAPTAPAAPKPGLTRAVDQAIQPAKKPRNRDSIWTRR